MYYETAKDTALHNGQDHHLAALLWRKNKLIRIGINNKRHRNAFSRYFQQGVHKCISGHAEMDALLEAKSGDILRVIRWCKDGTTAMAKPCKFCTQRLKRLNIKVYYTNTTGEWELLVY